MPCTSEQTGENKKRGRAEHAPKTSPQDLRSPSGNGRRRSGFWLAAAERLQAEFDQLLGPDAEVLLDALAQHGRQQLHVRHRALELDRELLLRRGQGRLLLDQILRPAQTIPEAGSARLQMGDLADSRFDRRTEALRDPQ